jgi:HPr kinase/phosphorylase
LLRHHVEVRGLGVLNIKDLFGVTAVRDRKRIDIVVRLDEWNEQSEYDRLGIDDQYFSILNTDIRLMTVPVRPGRDMGAMLEMAARNELLRRAGKHSARELLSRLEENATVGEDIALDDVPESMGPFPSAARTPTMGPSSYDAGRTALAASSGVSHVPPPPNSSLARPDLGCAEDPFPPRTVPSRVPSERSNESSAWIPAVRRVKGDS